MKLFYLGHCNEEISLIAAIKRHDPWFGVKKSNYNDAISRVVLTLPIDRLSRSGLGVEHNLSFPHYTGKCWTREVVSAETSVFSCNLS